MSKQKIISLDLKGITACFLIPVFVFEVLVSSFSASAFETENKSATYFKFQNQNDLTELIAKQNDSIIFSNTFDESLFIDQLASPAFGTQSTFGGQGSRSGGSQKATTRASSSRSSSFNMPNQPKRRDEKDDPNHPRSFFRRQPVSGFLKKSSSFCGQSLVKVRRFGRQVSPSLPTHVEITYQPSREPLYDSENEDIDSLLENDKQYENDRDFPQSVGFAKKAARVTLERYQKLVKLAEFKDNPALVKKQVDFIDKWVRIFEESYSNGLNSPLLISTDSQGNQIPKDTDGYIDSDVFFKQIKRDIENDWAEQFKNTPLKEMRVHDKSTGYVINHLFCAFELWKAKQVLSNPAENPETLVQNWIKAKKEKRLNETGVFFERHHKFPWWGLGKTTLYNCEILSPRLHALSHAFGYFSEFPDLERVLYKQYRLIDRIVKVCFDNNQKVLDLLSRADTLTSKRDINKYNKAVDSLRKLLDSTGGFFNKDDLIINNVKAYLKRVKENKRPFSDPFTPEKFVKDFWLQQPIMFGFEPLKVDFENEFDIYTQVVARRDQAFQEALDRKLAEKQAKQQEEKQNEQLEMPKEVKKRAQSIKFDVSVLDADLIAAKNLCAKVYKVTKK